MMSVSKIFRSKRRKLKLTKLKYVCGLRVLNYWWLLCFRRETSYWRWTMPAWTDWPTPRPWPRWKPPSASAPSVSPSWRWVEWREVKGNAVLNFLCSRDQKQVLEHRILYQVGCSGRNFPDSCSILRQSFSTGKTGPVGASLLLVINAIKIDNCIWGYPPSLTNTLH